MEFEWDPIKAETNERKHGVSFFEAAAVFGDTFSLTFPDPDHSNDEERFITIGTTQQQRLVIVAHTDRGNRIRIISARPVTRDERKIYEEYGK